MKFPKKTTMAVAVLLVALVAAAAWWSVSRGNGVEARYKTQAIERGDVIRSVSANGTLNPVILVSVGTQVSGTVKKLHVDFNDHVQKGQVLAELDDILFSSQLGQSEATLRSARATLDLAVANERRMQSLFKQEYASQQDLDSAVQAKKSAQAQVEQYASQVRKDRANLDYSVIRSPVSGVVVDRQIDIGQTVAASFQTPTLFKIAQDLSKMQIDSSFAEADIGAIKVGQPVRFNVDAFPNRSFQGSVKQVRLNPTTQSNVVTYDVVVAVDNPDQTLLPGMTAYVNIMVNQRNDVLTVPNAALRYKPADLKPAKTDPKRNNGSKKKRDASSAVVYVLDAGKPRAINITIGITDNRNTEVLTGELKPGNIVIIGENLPATGNASGNTPRMRMF
ncbi:Macrolide-specific efflux protein MacA [Georgfuchsia toluolica]|uniref:Macrolide-specific efflux protein MacA n=1 Tax=Georgfuchsia toluolica TaxID=424218 RepID=A0A916NIR4_9PROT|nr:efflux RND transporter periplasmic adaptor subunit [Georgfuchsia toluolica]CAG4884848.1 Macrolide-specific efflux protein MacA [Georgfuchsia toluolica]